MPEPEVFSMFVRDAKSNVRDPPVYIAGLRVSQNELNNHDRVREQPQWFKLVGYTFFVPLLGRISRELVS